VNPVVKLAHAVSCRATLTSHAEWQRLAREALAEYDRVWAENVRLRQAIKDSGPKFQGMNELA
jgi:hypothetical protein